MGTVFALRVGGELDAGTLDEIHALWRDIEARFSTFEEGSQISRIGRGELAIDDADPDVRHVLSVCAEVEAVTRGVVSVRPGRPGGPGLDPAAFVKGWSVDEAALVLRSAGHDDFVVYAGGDVLCSGSPAPGERWMVGIRDPREPDGVVAAIEVARGAVATSGAYERGAHVWGPAPGVGLGSATVMGPSLGMADALATALFAGGSDASVAWMGEFPGYSALLVTADGSLQTIGTVPSGFRVAA